MNNDELKAEIKDNSRVINLAINLIEEINEAREKNNMNTTEENTEDPINRLEEIVGEIEDLVDEAASIVRHKVGRSGVIYQRAEAYWIPHIKNSLDSDTQYGTITSTIEDIENYME